MLISKTKTKRKEINQISNKIQNSKMVFIKSIPKKHPKYHKKLSDLPQELKRLVLDFLAVDEDVYFACLGQPIDKSSKEAFFYTGRVRYKFVFPTNEVVYSSYQDVPRFYYGGVPSGVQAFKRVSPEVRVFRHERDFRQLSTWRAYERSLIGGRPSCIGKVFDKLAWKSSPDWIGSRRFVGDAGTNITREAHRTRAESQRSAIVAIKDCTTHMYYMSLVCETDPTSPPVLYGRLPLTTSSAPSHFREGGISYDEHTYLMELREKQWDEFGSEQSLQGYEEDSEYESEYDETTGEKIESIDIARYDRADRLHFNRALIARSTPPLRPRIKKRVANAHLKNDQGETILSPLSWCMSVNPKWRSSYRSRYVQPVEDEPLIVGRSRFEVDDATNLLGDIWESEWTEWRDHSDDSIRSDINLFQYYHVGIKPAYVPQPSFSALSNSNESCILLPLLEGVYTEGERALDVVHYSLERGLARSVMNYFNERIEDYQGNVVCDIKHFSAPHYVELDATVLENTDSVYI